MWRFNPPLAPHLGGVHETISMIKAAKKAIQAVLGMTKNWSRGLD